MKNVENVKPTIKGLEDYVATLMPENQGKADAAKADALEALKKGIADTMPKSTDSIHAVFIDDKPTHELNAVERWEWRLSSRLREAAELVLNARASSERVDLKGLPWVYMELAVDDVTWLEKEMRACFSRRGRGFYYTVSNLCLRHRGQSAAVEIGRASGFNKHEMKAFVCSWLEVGDGTNPIPFDVEVTQKVATALNFHARSYQDVVDRMRPGSMVWYPVAATRQKRRGGGVA